MCVYVRLSANIDGHCHLRVISGRWWTEVAVMPTALKWARKGSLNGITVGVEVVWTMLVKGQTEQGSTTSTEWSWLYSIVCITPVDQLDMVHQHPSPPVTVQVAVEPRLVRIHHCPLVVGSYGHLRWTQPLLAGEVAPAHVEVVARLQRLREVLHVLCQCPNLKVGVFPDQGPPSSVQLHLTVHL